MDEGNNLRIRILFQRVFHFLRINRRSPLVFHDDRYAAAALHVLDHAPAKYTIAAHNHLIPRADHIDETHFHADRTRTGNRESQQI